jgi:protease IV
MTSSGDSLPPAPPPSTGDPSSFEPPAARQVPPAGMAGIERSVEQMVRELLRERRAERRWRIFFRLAWFGLALALAALLFGQFLQGTPVATPHTALVEVRGEIAEDSEANADALVSALKSAFEDSGSVAVVLRINSPGGSPVQSGIVNDEIRRLKALHGKKVYAVVEEMCASGAYYIAAAADDIYVDKASLVGSIGVMLDGFGFVELMDKLGIERRLLTTGANKGMLDPFSPQDEAQRRHAQSMIDQVHRQFIAIVRQGRGERLKETAETFSGLYWNGEQAVAMGLADAVGNLDFVAREVVKAEDVIDYTPRENVVERLARRFGAGVGAGAMKALREQAPLR